MVNITVNMGKITNNEKYVYGAKFRGGGQSANLIKRACLFHL